MTTDTKPRGRVVEVSRGDIVSQEILDACRYPEHLVTSRYCTRRADGKIECRLPFKVWVPNK